MIVQLSQNLNKQSEDGRKLAKPQDIVRIYDVIIQVSLNCVNWLIWNCTS